MIRRSFFQQSVAANQQATASSTAIAAEDAVIYQSVNAKVSPTGTSSSSVSTVTVRSITNLKSSDDEKTKPK